MMPAASPPVVSIVMPCFNGVAHLPKSIGSVLSQTFPDWELIVVDDGSTDGSFAWLQAQTDPRLVLIKQANQGVSAARNAGLAVATAEYVAFLDADDTWASDYLARMVSALEAAPDAALAYCGWQNLGQSGGPGAPFVPPDYETPSKAELLFAGCRWPIHAALTRRAALVAAGGFDSRLKNAEDYHLWLKVAIPAKIVLVPAVLAFYHFHNMPQASSNHARAALHHWHAQLHYLALDPSLVSRLGKRRIRELTAGELLRRGYLCYWKRDLEAARVIFRKVMRLRYGALRDWKYMLPSLLPLKIHRLLIDHLDGGSPQSQRGQ